jgi:hypothetical protein
MERSRQPHNEEAEKVHGAFDSHHNTRCFPSTTFLIDSSSMSLFSLVGLTAIYCLALLVIPTARAFPVAPLSRAAFQCHSTRVYSSNDNNSDDTVDFSTFNPFQYQARSSAALGMTGTQISLRKTGMQQLVGELLSVYGNEDETMRVLEKYKEFLLEPLDDLEAVLDPESIYNNIDTREARFEAYRTSMEERIATAKDAKAKKVLTAMMEYVLQYE